MPALILIIDDDDMNREIMEAFLSLAGYESAQARDGGQGLERCLALHPHLILLDVRLPDISGYEVCRQIKADPRTRTIPVLMVSGYAGEDVHDEVMRAEADGFLERPFNSGQLLAKIQPLLPL